MKRLSFNMDKVKTNILPTLTAVAVPAITSAVMAPVSNVVSRTQHQYQVL